MKFCYSILALGLVMAVACDGSTPAPTTPSVTNPPVIEPPPVVTNTPPKIGTFTAQGSRTNEPPNFADASEDIPVSVEVTDAESAIGALTFNWSSPVGTFSGTGPKVIWKAPASVAAPTNVSLNLEVVETYTSAGTATENRVGGSVTVSLHDSVKEVGEMARQFLLDFSDSSKDVPTVMRNFQQGCYGTAEETSQVGDNRANFTIIQWNIGQANTTVRFGGICAFRNKPGDACARVPAYWKSIARRDIYDQFTGQLAVRAGQQTEAGPAVDQIAAMYYRDQRQWKLCDSQFDPDHTSLRAATIRGLVP